METGQNMEPQCYHLKVDASGRLILPVELRQELEITGGGMLIGTRDVYGLRLQTPEEILRQAQDYFTRLAPADRVLSEELLRERREEAARE
jgi:bifunctional DNA-binding transcriptional regulator/antitoxin component of YhaV-PrlF toxin-antitoxin module